MRQRRVMARPFITQKRVRAVHLMPTELDPSLFQARPNQVAPFKRHVRVLPTPDVKQLTTNLSGAVQRIVLHPLS